MERKPAKVLITFDDGMACHRWAADYLTYSGGLRGTFGLVTSKVDHEGFLDRKQILDMLAEGHFICNHSARHLWSGTGEAKPGRDAVDRAGITADLLAGRDWFKEVLPKGPAASADNLENARGDYLLVPYGTNNLSGPEHLRELLGYFKWIRMTTGGPTPGDAGSWNPEGNKRIYPRGYRGRTVGVTVCGDARHPGEVRNVLDGAMRTGGLVVICYHSVCSVTGSGMDIMEEQFLDDVDYMAGLVKMERLVSVIPTDII